MQVEWANAQILNTRFSRKYILNKSLALVHGQYKNSRLQCYARGVQELMLAACSFSFCVQMEYSLSETLCNNDLNKYELWFFFQVECEDIGPLLKIRIGHDNNGMRSAWFLEKVTSSLL